MSCRECFYITGHGDECSVGGAELRGDNAALTARIAELEDELEQARALTRYCENCHSAPGEHCTDDENKRCSAHAERLCAESEPS